MTMITPSYLGETIEYSSLHACRSTLEDPTTQTAGYLLSGGEYWWLVIPAGLAITLLCSAFYLVGRALDEVVNPRLRRR
jgi:ABC-type dipeptide/oligopeptide/nickel transport systems, permease components